MRRVKAALDDGFHVIHKVGIDLLRHFQHLRGDVPHLRKQVRIDVRNDAEAVVRRFFRFCLLFAADESALRDQRKHREQDEQRETFEKHGVTSEKRLPRRTREDAFIIAKEGKTVKRQRRFCAHGV